MLQMTSLELAELISQEMVTNPVLEEVQPGDEVKEISENILDQNSESYDGSLDNVADRNGDYKEFESGGENLTPEIPSENGAADNNLSDFEPSEEGASEEKFDVFEEIDYGREFQEYLDPGYKTQEIEHKEDAPSFEQFLSYSPSLTDHLEWQVNLQNITEQQADIAFCIIGNLDENGRLGISDEEIAEMCDCPVEAVEPARQVVLKLDPVGCGARAVKESLFAQLEANGEGDSLAAELVRDHFEDLPAHRLHHLAKETGIDIHVLNKEIDKIRILNPHPGSLYSSGDAIYVAPEIYIDKIEEEYIIYFTDDGSPRLRISQNYNQLLDQPDTTKETKDYIKEKVRSAVDLLRNIEHRRQTIYRVVECIVNRQQEFLDKGVQFIKPMMLKDVAEDIGMHLSTISRVVNRKYAHTPQGVIELRRFFSEGMLNEDGEEVSTRILKLKIKKMIEEENSKKPLTDDEIAKILGKDGVKLSRRTVAKYRDQMQIAGSRERKTMV